MIKQCKSFELGNFKIEYVTDGENEYIYLNGEPFEKTDISIMITWLLNEVIGSGGRINAPQRDLILEAEVVPSIPDMLKQKDEMGDRRTTDVENEILRTPRVLVTDPSVGLAGEGQAVRIKLGPMAVPSGKVIAAKPYTP